MSWVANTVYDPSNAGSQWQTRDSPQATGPVDKVGQKKRKRTSISTPNGREMDQEEMKGDDEYDESPMTSASKPRHQPGVKRACNDCRQQKLRCNVDIGPPYKNCTRCLKHSLVCSIDNDFKRLGKRAAHDEMVKELDACKAKLRELEAMGVQIPGGIPGSAVDGKSGGSNYAGSYSASPTAGAPVAPMDASALLGPSEAAASRSLLDLSQGYSSSQGYRELPPTSYPSFAPGTTQRTLGNVKLSEEQFSELFSMYFNAYHQFLPILSPETPYSEYWKQHPLLHWTIVGIAARRYEQKPGLLIELQRPLEELLWATVSSVPQTYHVCKALALLCTWPLPTSSTSGEPTMIIAGAMFQLAMQYGLHRPSHAQDFSRFRIDLRDEEITDRLHTWAVVNIIAQNVATGQGQPPLSRWAWYTYGLHLDRMKPELHSRCQIEKFCDTVTRTLFTMQRDHIVEVDQAQRGLQIDMYARELGEMEVTILSTRSSPIEIIYLKAAALHLRLAAFFDKPSQPNYFADLRNVYIAASGLLKTVLDLPPNISMYLPRYIEQMMLAGATTLLKLLNSFYASHVDVPSGRLLFSRTVSCLRQLSVRSNDLPQRLAEVMAQLWTTSGVAEHKHSSTESKQVDESLQLRVRCRSSLSVLYDAIWRWRQQSGAAGGDSLEQAVENPTAVTSATNIRNSPQPPAGSVTGPGGIGLLDNGSLEDPSMAWDGNFGGNAVFDPLSWALDGNLQLQMPGMATLGDLSFQI